MILSSCPFQKDPRGKHAEREGSGFSETISVQGSCFSYTFSGCGHGHKWLWVLFFCFFILKTASRIPGRDLWGITMTRMLILECESLSGRYSLQQGWGGNEWLSTVDQHYPQSPA